MQVDGSVAIVTGGASGLGLATADRLLKEGARVVIVDLPSSNGAAVAAERGDAVRFVAADVRDPDEVQAAVDAAEAMGPLRILVHCAGRGGALRLVDREGNPGSLELYTEVVTINLIGTFNVLRLAAASMAKNEPIDGDRGVAILTASVAAFEGQIGQIPYASAKAGVVGLTVVAARDLAGKNIRVCTIAPGTFNTPSSRCRSSTTGCSTARQSGSTVRSGCRRDERVIDPGRRPRFRRHDNARSSRSPQRD